MNKQRLLRMLLILILMTILIAVGVAAWPGSSKEVQSSVVGLAAAESMEGFDRADGSRVLAFPRDHGPHPDFQTEWWYYTGNLQTMDGRRFGYQLTFFRRAAVSPVNRQLRESKWGLDQVYLAHFTLTDVSANRFRAFERLERGAAGLAGAAIQPGFRVWLHDWSVEQIGPDQYRLQASQDDIQLDLELYDRKGPVLQGDSGYSQKGPEIGNASYYYSQTRLETSGQISVDGAAFSVAGLSWMDREFSTSALSQEQVGWDWFALQLEDGSELMVYVIRQKDGSPDRFSSGTWISPEGVPYPLKQEDTAMVVTSTWTSPRTRGVYPAAWEIEIPSLNIRLNVKPLIPDQELNVSYHYWEGAVQISGTRNGQPVTGSGYVELTGYAQSLEGGL